MGHAVSIDRMDDRAGGPPRKIMVIRHGEKPPPDGPPAGVREDGSQNGHSLTVRGWQRAGALVTYFAAPTDAAVDPPTYLYAPPPHGAEGDHGRPFQTLAPLAAKLGIAIDVRFGLDEEHELAGDVLRRSGVVLIAWEHKRIARIVDALIGDATAVPQWPDDRFDLVWILEQRPVGGYRLLQRPQLLLAGDHAEAVSTIG
jgi:hypothetical protein